MGTEEVSIRMAGLYAAAQNVPLFCFHTHHTSDLFFYFEYFISQFSE